MKLTNGTIKILEKQMKEFPEDIKYKANIIYKKKNPKVLFFYMVPRLGFAPRSEK